MKNSKIDLLAKKAVKAFGIAVPLILIFLFLKSRNDSDKFYAERCIAEKKLAFSGIVSKYETDVFLEKSTFLLNDSIAITIPRSSKQLMLCNGDSIQKIKNTNSYIVKSWLDNGRIDTLSFDCTDD